MSADVWGSYFWYFMHSVSFNVVQNNLPLTRDKKKVLIDFFLYIKDLLPCLICKTHYSEMLSTYPPSTYFTTGIGVSKWVVDIHNIVNKRLHKKKIKYNSAINMYKDVNHIKLLIFLQIITSKPLDKKVLDCIISLYQCIKCKAKDKGIISISIN